MARTRGVVVVAVVLVVAALGVFPAGSAVAQSQAAKGEELLLAPDGVADLRVLPQQALDAQAGVGNIHRHFPDAEALLERKAALVHGGGGATTTPPPAPTGILATGAPTLSATSTFQGLRQSESGGWYPPDTQVAAGPSHVVEAVNLQMRVFPKGGGPVSSVSLCTFFGVSCSYLSDPKIRFDAVSSRWFIAAIIYPQGTGSWLLAVSATDNPTGAFTVYKVGSASGTFPDFPGLGMSGDKVVLTANAFKGNSFRGAEFVVLNKTQLVNGQTVSAQRFGPFSNAFTIQPAFALSADTNTVFMADVAYNTATSIRLWSVAGVPGVAGGAAYTTSSRGIATLGTPPDARQQGTNALIVTNDNSLLDAVYRNGALWVAATSACTPSGDTAVRACARYIQIATGNLTVTQSSDLSNVGTYYYYPAIQLDSSNNLVTVFSGSSTSTYASVYASAQLAATPSTFQTPTLIKSGEGPYTPNRWGDYSGAAIDPSGTGVWVGGEYALGDGSWGTWIAEVSF